MTIEESDILTKYDDVETKKHVLPMTNEAKQTIKPPLITLTEDGCYDLSVTSNGKSTIRYFHDFIKPEKAKEIFETLKTELNWRQRKNEIFNLEEPRLADWQGEHRYVYWDIEWPPAPFSTTTDVLRKCLNKFLNANLNSVLGNYYRDNKDHVPWHCDNEPMLDKQPLIASLTFGAARPFDLRRKLDTDATDQDYEYVQRYRVFLESGSLLIMEGATQQDWEHAVLPTNSYGERINLTYRVINPS